MLVDSSSAGERDPRGVDLGGDMHMRPGPPRAQQDRGALPVFGQVDDDVVAGCETEFDDEIVGSLRRPVAQRRPRQLGAFAGVIVVVGEQRSSPVVDACEQGGGQRVVGHQFTHTGPSVPAVIGGALLPTRWLAGVLSVCAPTSLIDPGPAKVLVSTNFR
ncbi:Uncharacterised protein [Mycobacteroides abscessus subsp. abscessus]|nr:Uncharacterised protein [Mycobacteroides abscessus subsp. abscessus]